jgi:type IV pilus assembly protein PilB
MDVQPFIRALARDHKLVADVVTALTDAAARGEDVERMVVERGIATADDLLALKGKLLGLPIVSLIGRAIPPEVRAALSARIAERFHAIAFEREGNRVTVGLVDPTDSQAVTSIEFALREHALDVRYAIISRASFDAAFRAYDESSGGETAAAITEASEKFTGQPEVAEGGTEELEVAEAVARAPVSKIVSVVIRHAVEAHASDIHIEPFGKETRIRYRVDGVLKLALVLPIALHAAIVARIKVLASLKLDETRVPQDGRIHLREAGREVDLRVSTLPLLEQEKIVLRILESESAMLTLGDLGFRASAVAKIDRAVHRPNGMVLLTGPTGSGKSTTLYAVLNLLNREGVNIVTLEDPIEYYVRGVNQGQVRPEVGFTFASGLRAILRQDPNIIMVGEIRDTETAELAIHAGLTGHLLFSTLHTRDVGGVVPRLIDMKIEPFLLASTLVLAEAQRLVRRNCPDCRADVPVPAEIIAELERGIATLPAGALTPEIRARGVRLTRGQGCPKCGGTGYRGRTVVSEVLEFTEPLQELIIRGFPQEDVAAIAAEQGMLTLRQDALVKALEGETTYEEVLRITHE